MKLSDIRLLVLAISLFIVGCNSQEKATPTQADIQTATPIPGWHVLNGNGVSLWLPNSFEGGNPKTNGNQILNRLQGLGSNFDSLAQTLRSGQKVFNLLAYDTITEDSGLITNVLIDEEIVPENINIESYLDTLAGHLPSEFQIIEKVTIPSPSNQYSEEGYLKSTINTPKGKVMQVIYVIRKDGSIWRLVFTTPESEYAQRATIFEQSMHSVTIQSNGENTSPRAGSPFIMLIGLFIVIGGMVLNSWQKRRKTRANQNTLNNNAA